MGVWEKARMVERGKEIRGEKHLHSCRNGGERSSGLGLGWSGLAGYSGAEGSSATRRR